MCTYESILAAIFTRAANNGTSLFIFAVAVHILMPGTFILDFCILGYVDEPYGIVAINDRVAKNGVL